MNGYRVAVTATAVKERQKLDVTTRQRIDKALQGLIENARPSGAKKLAGSANDWRIHVGDYRILYEVDDRGRLITVWRIAHRREVYR
ncbi:MAG: type II toxin-antitoxin system RelE/ParE family toxin [Ardenticatenaceae bacterium]|nr:type II toxin-antitoxin system RelE/ParE family toxin [Ardenticatenaceae bacterium]